ncbi:hypothetical protein IWW40_001326 [Coemansia sp. RSA 1250]|nr:hypothetical protein LPJ68_001740 [Coemansia sp. RSA 1086]KAJ2652129.1 hypothetical protein IWW40_001326 [Coemansia sp. RSA 1250]
MAGRYWHRPLAQMMQWRGKHKAVRMGGGQLRKVMGQFKDTPTTIYDRQVKATHYSWAPWVAAGQMLMFINFADFYYRHSTEKNEETGEYTIAPLWKRLGIAGISLVAGVSIGGGLLHFVSRSVRSMQVEGKMVVLETFRMTGRGTRKAKYPIGQMFSRDKLVTGVGDKGVSKGGSPQYSIYVKGGSYAYIMNRDGKFMDPHAFDTLFYRASVF